MRIVRSVVTAATIAAVLPATAAGAGTAAAAPPRTAATTATAAGTVHAIAPRALITGRRIPAHAATTVPTAGRAGLPTHVGAVFTSIRVAATTASGSLVAYAAGTVRPHTSTVSFDRRQHAAGSAIVAAGPGGAIALYNSSAQAITVSVDVSGYTSAGTHTVPGGVHMIAPNRILSANLKHSAGDGLGSYDIRVVPIEGTRDVPATGVSAAIMVLHGQVQGSTATVVAWPHQAPYEHIPKSMVHALTLSPTPSSAVVVVPVGAGGRITLANTFIPGNFILSADLVGYVRSGASTTGSVRALLAANVARTGSQPLSAHGSRHVVLTGHAGIPANGVAAVLAEVRAASARAGAITVTRSGHGWRTAQPVAYPAGHAVGQVLLVPLGVHGDIVVRNSGTASATIAIDVVGYVLSAPPARVGHATVTRVGANTVTLGWTRPAGASDTGVEVRRIPNGSAATPTTGTLVGRFPAATTSASDVNLAPRQNYTYALFAHDAANHYAAPAVVHVTTSATPSGAVASAPTAASPLAGDVTGVSCTSDTFCMMVDRSGLFAIFDGTAWTTPARAFAGSLVAVSCTSDTFCLAASDDPAGDAVRYDGTSWTPAGSLGATAYTVSCAGPQLCVAQSHGVIHSYDGTAWSTQPTAQAAVAACAPGSHYCLVIDARGVTESFDGTTWTARAKGPVSTTELTCTSTTFCLALGTVKNPAVFDGTSWHVDATEAPLPQTLSCSDPGYCMGVDGAMYQRKNGTWSGGFGFVGVDLQLVSCMPSRHCITMTIRGDAYVIGEDLHAISKTTVDPPSGGVAGLTCATATFCAGIERGGHLITSTSTRWSVGPAIPDSGDLSDSVTGPTYGRLECPTDSLCFAAPDLTVLRRTGATWRATATPNAHFYRQISCLSGTFCVASSGDGVRVWNGRTWGAFRPVPGGEGYLGQFACASGSLCFGAGTSPDGNAHMLRFDGRSWHVIATPRYLLNSVLDCVGPTLCLSVGLDGILRWDGVRWVSLPTPAGLGNLRDGTPVVGSCSTSRCALAHGTRVVGYDGYSWSAVTTLQAPETDLACAGSTCVAADDQGNLRRLSFS